MCRPRSIRGVQNIWFFRYLDTWISRRSRYERSWNNRIYSTSVGRRQLHYYETVSGQLPPRIIVPRLELEFGLVLGLCGQFSLRAIVLEPYFMFGEILCCLLFSFKWIMLRYISAYSDLQRLIQCWRRLLFHSEKKSASGSKLNQQLY